MSDEHLSAVVEAMCEDSQKGTSVSRQALSTSKSWSRDTLTVSNCNILLQHYGLPRFDEKFYFNDKQEIVIVS